MNNLPENPENKISMGHEDLKGFANHLGISFDKLTQINRRNSEIIKKTQNSKSKF